MGTDLNPSPFREWNKKVNMKLGIVSDIHAQAPALRRALEDMPAWIVYSVPAMR